MKAEAVSTGPLSGANIGEIVIYTRQFDEMLVFYQDTLGLELEQRTGRIAALRGEAGAEVVLHQGGKATQTERNWLLQFLVADIETARAELGARGVSVSEIDERPYGRYARFSDPDGNILGLEETPGDAEQGVTEPK